MILATGLLGIVLAFSYTVRKNFQQLRDLESMQPACLALQDLLAIPKSEKAHDYQTELLSYLHYLRSSQVGQRLLTDLKLERLQAVDLEPSEQESIRRALQEFNHGLLDHHLIQARAQVEGGLLVVFWASVAALLSLLAWLALIARSGQTGSRLPLSFTQLTISSDAEEGTSVRGYTERVLQSLSNFLILASPDGTMQTVNDSLCDKLGYQRNELVGASLSKLLGEQGVASEPGYRGEATLRTSTGQELNVLLSRSEVKDDSGTTNGLVVVAQDVSQLKQVEAELRDNQQRLAVLLERLVTAQEDERKRVARELHDGMLQAVIAAELKFKSFLKKSRKSGEIPHKERLEAGLECLSDAVSEGRRLIQDLRPPTLDKFGLVESIKYEVEKLGRDLSCVTEFDCPEDLGDLPQSLENALYRICQEACNNIRKHSKPTRVEAELSLKAEELSLSVKDDGEGFEISQTSHQGVGLSSMRERAELHGGQLWVKSAADFGTEIYTTIPLRASDYGQT